jgi:hypothetical protein
MAPFTKEPCVPWSKTFPPYLVKASRFSDWWMRLNEFDRQLPEDMTDAQWRETGQDIRALEGV